MCGQNSLRLNITPGIFLVLESEPAAYIALTSQAERQRMYSFSNEKLWRMDVMSGTEAEIDCAAEAAIAALEGVQGKPCRNDNSVIYGIIQIETKR